MQQDKTGRTSVETRYSIVVCIAMCYINAMTSGWLNTAASVVSALEDKYHDTPLVEAQASLVNSLYAGLFNLTMFILVAIIRLIGVRITSIAGALLIAGGLALSPSNKELFLWIFTYSVPGGLATAAIYGGLTVSMTQYFDRHQGRMFGLMCGSSGVMGIFIPIIWSSLAPLGFSNTLYVFALVFLSTIIPMLLLKPRKDLQSLEKSKEDAYDLDSANYEDEKLPLIATRNQSYFQMKLKQAKEVFHFELFSNKTYMAMSLGVAISTFGLYIPVYHLPGYTKLYYRNVDTNVLVSAMGVGQTISKLVLSSLVDYVPFEVSYYFLQLGFVGCALTAITISYVISTQQAFSIVVILMVAYGIFEGPAFGAAFPIMRRVVDRDSSAFGSAYQYAMTGVTNLLGPPIAGLLFDLTHSYALCYYFASIPLILGSLIMFMKSRKSSDA